MDTESPRREAKGFFRKLIDLAGGYWTGERRWQAWFLTAALVVLTLIQVVVPVAVNFWSQQFFDALEQHSMDRFVAMIGLLCAIIAGNMTVQVLHLQVKRRLQYGWREWLTREVAESWLWRGRHHQIMYLPGDHDNPDGRMAEDIRITTEYAVDLAHSLFYCVILLASFTQILWMISGAPEITVAGVTFAVPGYLLYLALAYAGAGTVIAMLLGRPLVRAANRRQGREADFRFGLMRVRENSTAIALLHAESEERRRLFDLMVGLKQGWAGQTRALSFITTFSSGWSVLSTAFPLLVAAPRYISGAISLGVLMQTAQAFQQTVAALSWPIDNLGRVAEWKASVERVLGLRDVLRRLELDISGRRDNRITVEHSMTEKSLSFADVTITEAAGKTVIERFSAVVRPGERVLISGDPGATIKLFRSVARTWPWGSGTIKLPAHTRVFVMPQRPYLPSGALRDALCYPGQSGTASDEAMRDALMRVGMDQLAARLDEVGRWRETLALAEQQRLGFARLLLRRPDWIFVEAATDALDPASEEQMLHLLDVEFPRATLVTIGSHASLDAHHGRKFILERVGDAVRIRETAPALVLGEPEV